MSNMQLVEQTVEMLMKINEHKLYFDRWVWPGLKGNYIDQEEGYLIEFTNFSNDIACDMYNTYLQDTVE